MDSLVPFVAPLLSFALLGWLVLSQLRLVRAKRRAENKVRMSDHILLADIKILARMNSRLLDDAIVLRSAHIEHGRDSTPKLLSHMEGQGGDF